MSFFRQPGRLKAFQSLLSSQLLPPNKSSLQKKPRKIRLSLLLTQWLHQSLSLSKKRDRTLNQFGFTQTERIDAEWNINICDGETDDRRTQYYINYRNEKGGSHCAAALFEMQRCKVDAAMYYDSQLWLEYGSLFHVPSLAPTKAYYAFRQFGELYALGGWCGCARQGWVYTCAATDGRTDLAAFANIGEGPAVVPVSVKNAHGRGATLRLCDREHDFTVVYEGAVPGEITLPAYSFASLTIR